MIKIKKLPNYGSFFCFKNITKILQKITFELHIIQNIENSCELVYIEINIDIRGVNTNKKENSINNIIQGG